MYVYIDVCLFRNLFVYIYPLMSVYSCMQVIFDPFRTGFEENKDYSPPKGSIIAGRYEVVEVLGQVCIYVYMYICHVCSYMCMYVSMYLC